MHHAQLSTDKVFVNGCLVGFTDYDKGPWPRDGEPNRQLAFYQLAAPNFLARVETTRAINHFNEQWTARKRLAEQQEAERHG